MNISASDNVCKAWGSILLMDPPGADPMVVTGSANFSKPSTNANDKTCC